MHPAHWTRQKLASRSAPPEGNFEIDMNERITTIFVVGECMIELQRDGSGLAYRFGGDTLNAAVYLARLIDRERFAVAYVTGLGTDAMSAEMCATWEKEGIATQWVQRLPDKLPGMYMIETDPRGERRFHYWRNDSAARYWLTGPQSPDVCKALSTAPTIYLSGISLAILPPSDRELLFESIAACRQRGGKIVFDNNYRPRLWPDRETAVAAYRGVLEMTDIALLTLDDEEALYGTAGAELATSAAIESAIESAITRARLLGVREVVVKRGADSCIVQAGDQRIEAEPERVAKVVDTTAAGDSFGAAYLAVRLAGGTPSDAARAGHRLAATVIQHRGAIIPLEAMPQSA